MEGQTGIILIGALAGLFPILLTASLSWLEKRSLMAKRDRALDLAQKRVEFLDVWVKVQETLCSAERFEEIKREASNELDQLMENLSERLAEEEEEEPVEVGERNLLERLFLAYLPYNVAGWVMHILFYMFLGMSLLLIWATGLDADTGRFSWSVLADPVNIILVFIFFGIPTLFIRWLAVRVDRKAEEKIVARAASKRA